MRPRELWRWEGVFSLEVPFNWEVREREGGLIELCPSASTSAAHISILRREGTTTADGEAQAAVQHFATTRGARSLKTAAETRSGQEHTTAQASYLTEEAGTRLWWDVMAHVWPSRGALCSFARAEQVSPHRDIALEIFSSLRPD